MKKSDIKDIRLAKEGKRRIEWAANQMPVLELIQKRFSKEKPLKGVRMACCLHVTTETAVLAVALTKGGADVVLCASNPLSTQDDVAASLVKDYGIKTFSIRGENRKLYYQHVDSVLDHRPHITMDDGADLVSELHGKRKKQGQTEILGGTEETTTGVIRLKSLEKQGLLYFPIIAVNDAQTKHFFDNRFGTGQSTIDGILRATNILLAGKIFVVAGYGWCSRGIAMRARGMGARVIICEIDPVRGLEALMDGFEVCSMNEAAKIGDIFVTATGCNLVFRAEHFKKMKDGAILANSGHFNVEIDIAALKKMSSKRREVRENVEEYTVTGKKRIYVLGEGRLVNLACAEGHPAIVMDMSFANQALSAEYIYKNHKKLKKQVYSVPEKLDKNIALLKLKSIGVTIDTLIPQQKKYLDSWNIGT